MLFAVGTKVRLKHTGDKGQVMELLADGMLSVLLQWDDMEIPVFEEDLVLESEYVENYNKHAVDEGIQKKRNSPNIAEKMNISVTKSIGVQIAFDPDYDMEGLVKKYKIFLLNDTKYDYLFSVNLERTNSVPKLFNGKLDSVSVYLLDELLYDDLNESPTFTIDCWQITTAGTEGKQTQTIKLKPKQFFKKVAVAPLINRPVHLYFLFDPSVEVPITKKEDLKSYTKDNIRAAPKKNTQAYKRYEVHNVKEYANFNHELDLHLENISTSTKKMNSGEKLRLQLQHFDAYIAKAIRLGVPRVFIIHGLGKGRLRNEIASRLIKIREVKTFKNEYHHKYGFGATEVIF